jgi:hypothetical protein
MCKTLCNRLLSLLPDQALLGLEIRVSGATVEQKCPILSVAISKTKLPNPFARKASKTTNSLLVSLARSRGQECAPKATVVGCATLGAEWWA